VALNHDEQFTFDILATTALHYCQFSLKMTVVDGTRTVTETLNNHGKPFQVTATIGPSQNPDFSRYSVVYLGGTDSQNGKWSQLDPATAANPSG
jgi:hypothetical protein